VNGHRRAPGGRLLGLGLVAADAAGQDVREALYVVPRDHFLAAVVLLAQAVDQLSAQDVDLAVQNPALVGDVDLFVRQLRDEVLELLVG
jgi:hypothetical protein